MTRKLLPSGTLTLKVFGTAAGGTAEFSAQSQYGARSVLAALTYRARDAWGYKFARRVAVATRRC